MLWAGVATLSILAVVNFIMPIRLSPEEETQGCDITEHHLKVITGTELQKSLSTIDRILTVSTPIAMRFAGPTEMKNTREIDDFGRRKGFHTNRGYEEN